jgi:uncharacterized protein YjbI with pentapeptide repeats
MAPDELVDRYVAGERDFRNVDLSGATITETLNRAAARPSFAEPLVLDDANFTGADVSGAYLRNVRMVRAKLRNVDFRGTYLSNVDFSFADLCYSNLLATYFRGGRIAGARLTGTLLGHTVLVAVDLAELCKQGVSHLLPSTVDFRSVARSIQCPKLGGFLRDTGMPQIFVDYTIDCARGLDPTLLTKLMRSTFISYGGPDEPFAQRLNDALKENGVTTFFFRDDAPAGSRLSTVMRQGVNEHDRVILICSEASLSRPGLLNELVETLAREARDGGKEYLIPIRLDEYVFEWQPDRAGLAQTLRDRVIADFSRHAEPRAFRRELDKLLTVLRRGAIVE